MEYREERVYVCRRYVAPNPVSVSFILQFLYLLCSVKSENDRLSDTQRLWIHVLSTAGIKVELCHALANKELTADELEGKEM